jgi:hypothetical protein
VTLLSVTTVCRGNNRAAVAAAGSVNIKPVFLVTNGMSVKEAG